MILVVGEWQHLGEVLRGLHAMSRGWRYTLLRLPAPTLSWVGHSGEMSSFSSSTVKFAISTIDHKDGMLFAK
jgi:hypothetical protein